MADFGCRYYYVVVACEHKGKLLMLHRNRRKHVSGFNGRWMGIVGEKREKVHPHIEAKRIFKEETGLTATKVRYRGLIQMWPFPTVVDGKLKFVVDGVVMFDVMKFEGELQPEARLGTYEWVDKDKVYNKLFPKLWRPDRTLLKCMRDGNKLVHLRYSLFPDDTVYRAEWFWEPMTPEQFEEWNI